MLPDPCRRFERALDGKVNDPFLLVDENLVFYTWMVVLDPALRFDRIHNQRHFFRGERGVLAHVRVARDSIGVSRLCNHKKLLK